MRTNKGFLELRRLEAARDIANLLSTSGNRVMLDSASLLLNGNNLPIIIEYGIDLSVQSLGMMERRFSKSRSRQSY